MRFVFTALTAGAILFSALGLAAAPLPNIVLIISDDQAWGDYSFMGHPHIRTPHLDRLAAQSLVFPRGYVPSSLCCPSLATMITGLFPHQHKITSNDPPSPIGKPLRLADQDPIYRGLRQEMIGFIDQVPTLPRMLAQKGYASFQTGKWWQGHYSHGGFTAGMSKGGRHGDEGLKIGRETMQPVYDFIASATAEEKPFFVWYAPMLPHTPHNPPERLLQKYKDQAPSEFVAKYWANCEWFDETCGQLLEHLDQQGLSQNTIVVYVTDNGWIQDSKLGKYAPRSKQSQYDGGLRTPIMVRWPGKVKPQKSIHLAQSIDLMPTLLAAVGLKATPTMQGINLLDEKAVAQRQTLFGECFTHNAVEIHKPASSLRWRWIIEGDWKLILPAPQNESGAVELFNLAKDPHEEKNLAAQEAQVVKRLSQKLDDWWPGKI